MQQGATGGEGILSEERPGLLLRRMLRLATAWDIEFLMPSPPSRCTIPRNADCTQAFVNADSDVLTYIKPPAGIQDVEVGEFLALHKSLYGLKQSSRNWYLLVSKWLTERKWEMFCNNECLWRKNDEFTFFHVDDFHYLLQSEESYQEWFKEFSLPFPAKDLGTSSQILGMNLRYLEDGSISLDQERY